MQFKKNVQILSSNKKPILLDAFYEEDNRKKPVIIFCHGFKGFKDWGTFDLIGEYFAEQGCCFIKFNFSHNGTTPDQPDGFADPEAFANNNYSKELDDLGDVIDWIFETDAIPEKIIDKFDVNVIGHSRGGSISILKSYEDDRINKGISWSAPKDLNRWQKQTLEDWENNGVTYVENARTGQQLPMNYQIIKDLYANRERLDVQKAIQNLDKPFMVAHGTEDEAVSYEDAISMKSLNSNVKLELVPNAGHTYGGSHPYNSNRLPENLFHLLNTCVNFLKS